MALALGVAGTVGASGPVGRPGRATAVETDPKLDRLHGFDVRDFGAVRGGTTDCTSAFQAAVDEASRAFGRVVVPNGTWRVESITVPRLVKIVGTGADVSYYGSSTSHAGGATLVRPPSAPGAMISVNGHGVTLENLTLLGKGGTAPLVHVRNGFESRFSRLRLHGVAGTALLVDQVNNNAWTDVFVDDAGSADAAAVVIRSPCSGTNSNTVTLTNLTIERSANVALDLGWGAASADFVEFVRLVAPHIEGAQPSGSGLDALIRVGNVRSVDVVAPFVYGGPGPLLSHHERRPRGGSSHGGVRVLGGTFMGSTAGSPAARSSVLVDLVAGDDFAVIGTRMAQFTTAAVRVAATYGADVSVDDRPNRRAYDDRGAPATRPGLVDERVG